MTKLDPALCRRLADALEAWESALPSTRRSAAAQLTAAAEMAERVDVLEGGLDSAIDIAAAWINGSPTDSENLNLLRKIRDGWWPPTGNGPAGKLVAERDAYRAMVIEILASARPHPVEHPLMAAAWAHARDLLRNEPLPAPRPAFTADEVRAAVREAMNGSDAPPRTLAWCNAVAARVAEKLAGRSLADPARDEHCSRTGGGCQLHPRGCPPALAAAFDRAAVAITGQPAATLAAQLAPPVVGIGPDDTVIIDRALGHWSSDHNDAPHDDIARIRALLTGRAPS